MGGGDSGDRTEQWRAIYRRVRKAPLSSTAATNQRRLSTLDVRAIDGGRWLDLGSGDGNLTPQLLAAGAEQVVSIDYQIELVRYGSGPLRLVGSAGQLPLVRDSIDVAVVMDVLHHLEPEQLRPTLCELRRVVRPNGHLLVFEPVSTVVRRVLGAALMSPLAGLTEFSRSKRRMVELEASTLEPWLRSERRFADVLEDSGFTVERHRRGVLHGAYRCRLARSTRRIDPRR